MIMYDEASACQARLQLMSRHADDAGPAERAEGRKPDQRGLEKAKAVHKHKLPQGMEECGTDALRFALVSSTAQVTKPIHAGSQMPRSI